MRASSVDFIDNCFDYFITYIGLPMCAIGAAGAAAVTVAALVLPVPQERLCQNAVSAAKEVGDRATVENAVLGLARNSNEGTTPSAYRPDSNVERAIARVRQDCFAQHAL
jgi:hypothetical protein